MIAKILQNLLRKVFPQASGSPQVQDESGTSAPKEEAELAFRYEALDGPSSFRTIELLAGKPDDPLECRLVHTSVEEAPKYEAISYVWGNENQVMPIICNGQPMNITHNLASVLRRVRKPDDERILWADGICIDQQKLEERNNQVFIMDKIYQNATGVLISLGTEDDDTHEAVELIQSLASQEIPNLDDFVEWRNAEDGMIDEPSTKAAQRIDELMDLCPVDSTAIKGMKNLLNKPWFFRAWTFQEAFLAQKRTFFCGKCQIPGVALELACGVLYKLFYGTNNLDYLPTACGKIEYMIVGPKLHLGWKDKTSFSTRLLELLSRRAGSQCKEPSDLIYSLLGTASEKLDLVPDYSSPFEQVFATAALQIIEMTLNLDIFSHVSQLPPSALSSLPSWVPDWRRERDPRITSFTWVAKPLYFATGTSKPSVRFSKGWRELHLEGILWDSVEVLWDFDESSEAFGSGIRQYLEQAGQESPEATSTYPKELVIRTCCADLKAYDYLHDDFESRWDEHSWDEVEDLLQEGEDGTRSSQCSSFIDTMIEESHRSSFFETGRSRLGRASNRVQAGDVIALLLGGRVPIILRPQGKEYTFVSECYIDGFMDGEGLVEAREEADPDYDGNDTSWLERLHEEAFTFDTTEFTLV